jgi:3',5'-cyclic AMP phosphodiesterase CpdA
VYGDTRTNIFDHGSVVSRIIEHSPDLVIDTGDLVTDGRIFPLWEAFFLTIRPLAANVPYYTVLGNHEYNAQHYYDLFHLPKGGGKEGEQWYSFDYGNVHFVCLDSNVRDSREQLEWLEKDLSQASGKAQWLFVVFHHPTYSSGDHGSEYETIPKWLDAFERYGVDIVFNGHDHHYERSFDNDIWYVLTGGGGAPLRPVNQNPNPKQVYAEMTLHFCKLDIDGGTIEFEMIRADGTVGDSMTITK